MPKTIEELTTKLWSLGAFPSRTDAWELLINLPYDMYEELVTYLKGRKQTEQDFLSRLTRDILDDAHHDRCFGKSSIHMDDYRDNEVTHLTSDSRATHHRYDRLIEIIREVGNSDAAELYRHQTFDETCNVVIPDFNQINLELIEYFSTHPEELDNVDWRQFEKLLDAVFKNQGYTTELGPGSGDGGVDIRMIQKDSVGEFVTLVQAKRYNPKYPINLEAVAALYGVVEAQQANRGLFVSTSRFLPSALKFAKQRKHKLLLAGTKEIIKWCKDITAKH